MPPPADAPASVPAPDPTKTSPDLQRIRAAARTHFFTEGFHTFTMDDLARELGMSKRTLYQHFPSKEALLESILTELADDVGQMLSKIASDPAVTAAERLRRMVDGIGGKLSLMQPVFLTSLRRHAPRQFELLDQLRRRNLERHLLPLLEAGRRRGEIRRDVDPLFVVELLLRALHGIFEADTLQRMRRSPAQAVAEMLDLFFRGLLNPLPPTSS